ncbi:MAG: polysaccharide biosynthesis protein [Firmicutes bacterium]|nr:polysaccharide biosynthesis protein [Bacillota bacterium]
MGIWRKIILILIDAVLINVAIFAALWLRFDGNIPSTYIKEARTLIPLISLIFPACFYYFKLYNRLWAYASVRELLNIVTANTAAMSIFIVCIYLFPLGRLPRSIYLIAWLLSNLLIGGSRLTWRIVRDYYLKPRSSSPQRVLIVGAGDAGAMVVRELQHNGNGNQKQVVGFVDDDPAKQKMYLHGVPVLGTRDDIPALVERHDIDEIIIAMPSVPGAEVRRIVEICRPCGVKLKTLPGLYEIIDGSVRVNRIRDVDLEDLLRREPVQVNMAEIAGYLRDQVVLVTGAGGSIGSEELCRQIARFQPRQLLLLDNCENNLFEIDLELRNQVDGLEITPLMADVKDVTKINYIFERYKPQVVFHAAAYKHVPMMELHPDEAFKNNVLGTRVVAEAADRHGSRAFILISTDKAVNPTSVMGATKRLAEIIVQNLSRQSQTKFASVRFGNVLGSRGSVVPLFKKQIAQGGPVTVTHPEMKRYFMTIPEAVQLVIQAGAMAEGGETFVLDMGEPIKIVDMARDLIRLSGLRPDEDIKIVFTGVRPGEKLYEELLTAEEGTVATRHERIFVVRVNADDHKFTEISAINKILKGVAPKYRELINELFVEEVPGYKAMARRQTG